MTNALGTTHDDDASLLMLAWRTTAGLLVVAGVIYGSTALIESFLPALPDQAHAGTQMPTGAPTPARAGFSPSQAAAPVEHFHVQFKLQPGQDTQAHVEAF